jgi:threonine dehydratase
MATIHATAHAVTDVCFADIVAARQRIAGGVLVTPCVESPALSAITGAQVFCKLDRVKLFGVKVVVPLPFHLDF